MLDFRVLNDYLESHTRDSHNCSDTLRSWRQNGEELGVLDLRKVYLQIHMDPELCSFQRVAYKGEVYSLT